MPYQFQKTPYGSVQVMQNGKQVALTTPDLASMQYGYQAGPASPKRQESGNIPLGGGFGTDVPKVTPFDAGGLQSQQSANQPPINNDTISGSASVINGMNTTKAMTSAGASVSTPPVTANTPAPGTSPNVSAGAAIGGFVPSTVGNNVAYTDPQSGKVISSVPAGTSLSPQYQQSLSYASSAMQSLKPGYSVGVLADGSVQFKDTSGNTVGTVTPTGNPAIDQRQVDQMTGQMGSYDSTITAIQAERDSQNKAIDTELNTQITQIEDQRKAALGAARSTFGQPDAATSTADSSYTVAINDKFDKLAQQARADAESAKAKIASGTQSAIASAGANLSATFADISQKAQGEATTEYQFAKNQEQSSTQFSATNALNQLKSLDLPSATIQGLTIGANGTTGNAAVDAVVGTFVASGKTPQQALALVQAGSLAANKQTQTDWINLMKNTPIQIPAGTTLEQAQQDPYLAEMIRQGTDVLGSPEASFGFLQSTSVAAANLQKTQAQTNLDLINAQLAPLKYQMQSENQTIKTVQDATNNAFKPNQWGAQLSTVAQWMGNVDASYNKIKSGNYTSATTFIDAITKINTGGQAIRQGQTDLQFNSGTIMDNLASLATKYGFSIKGLNVNADGNLTGTTQLSPQQVDLMYQDIQSVANEKIQNNLPAYEAYKAQIQDAKSNFSTLSPQFDGMTAWTAGVDQFMQSYQGGGGGGSSFSIAGGSTYDGITLPN